MEEPERPEQQADWPGRASDEMTNRLMVNRAKCKAVMYCTVRWYRIDIFTTLSKQVIMSTCRRSS